MPRTDPVTEVVRAASAVRGERVIHAKGRAFAAVLDVFPDAAGLAVPLVRQPGPRDVLARFSRGAGLPDRLPDVLGLALRVPDADGAGGLQDLLVASAGTRPGLRHLLVVRRDYAGTAYTSLTPFSVAGRLLLLGALPDKEGPPALDPDALPGRRLLLVTATLLGPWQPFARLTIGAPLPASEGRRLAFDVRNNAGGFVVAGPFPGLRARAYPAARGVEG